MRKQTGWLVRDPKGRVVVCFGAMVYQRKTDAIANAWSECCASSQGWSEWWRDNRKYRGRDGYTVEKVSL
jgi:hypothetical protein